MLYSSGMPILYPVATVGLFLMYWLDKLVLVRWSKRPLPYTLELCDYSVHLMQYSLIPHFILGFFMFSNQAIFSSNETKV